MTTIVSGSSITFNDNTTQNTSAYGGGFAFRNRIINGDCRIDQRNAGASVSTTIDSTETYTIDRWYYRNLVASKYTIQQNAGSVTPPTGFTNYLGCTSTSAYTVGASEFFTIGQAIEGYNVADLDFGKATAKTVTLSFWARSSLTGTFGGVVANSGFTRTYPFTYSIPVANTWTNISITISGDTSGTWLTTNGIGLNVRFSLGAGSTYSGTAGAWGSATVVSATGATSVVGTNGATFYITGVQLEKGSTATSFDYRPYGQELALCQRYYLQTGSASAYQPIFGAFGTCITTTLATLYFPLPVSMRASPTLTYTGTPRLDNGQAGFNISAMNGAIIGTNLSTGVLNITSTGLTLYQPVKIDTNAGGSIVTLSAEL